MRVPAAVVGTSSVVAATLVAAVAMWAALPVDGAGGQPATPVQHPPATAMAGMHMAGMKMRGMKMPMRSTPR